MLTRSTALILLMFTAIGPVSAAPIAPLLITPIGSQTSSSPEFQWTQVDDATWYRVWTNTPKPGLLPKWVRAADACNVIGDGICHYAPAATFEGTTTWQVRGYDGSELGDWSNRGKFWTDLTRPESAALLSPLGFVSDDAPFDFVWNAVADASWYKLQIQDSEGINVVNQWIRGTNNALVCLNGACSYSISEDIQSDFRWRVRTYNAAGLGPWAGYESVQFIDFPALESLTISGTEITTQPQFRPGTLRYSVLPTSNTTGITVSASPMDTEHSVTVNSQLISDGESVTIASPAEGEVINIDVTAPNGEQQRYELVHLAVGFPVLKVTTLNPGVSEGKIFLNTQGGTSFATVIDNNGVPYYLKRTPPRSSSFQKHPDGRSSYGQSNQRVILDENLQELERLNIAPPLTRLDQHDFLILPNGNYVFLSYDPEIHDGVEYEDSVIQEVDHTTGEVVFEWRSWGVIPLEDQLRPDETEYAHINSVFLDDDGHFLASLRGVSQIVKINRDTGAVMWKLGGLSNEFTINDSLGGPCGQHDVTRLPSGNILFFDNGIYCPPDYPDRGENSRAVEYEIDEINKVATLVWSYSQGTFSAVAGSARRMPNGNTIIGWGGRTTGSSGTEVDANGNVVWEFDLLRGDTVRGSYRILRYID